MLKKGIAIVHCDATEMSVYPANLYLSMRSTSSTASVQAKAGMRQRVGAER